MEQQQPQQPEKTFDTTIFQDYLKSKLRTLFDTFNGRKLLIADSDVISLLTMILGAKQIQELSIKYIHDLDKVDQIGIDKEFNHALFFVYPSLKSVNKIGDIIMKDKRYREESQSHGRGQQQVQDVEYTIIYWPQRTILCDQAIETMRLKYIVNIKDFSFDLVPLDDDLLSFEFSQSFYNLYLKQDLNIYKYIAESIQKIQTVFGKAKNTFAKGDGSRIVLDILNQEEDISREINGQQSPEIESIIIMDRNIDLLTPLLYEMEYESQLVQEFGITGNIMQIDAELVQGPQQQQQEQQGAPKTIGKIMSGQSSQIYKEIRNLHSSVALNKIQEFFMKFQEIKNDLKQVNRNNVNFQTLSKQLKHYQIMEPDLELHYKLYERIFKRIQGQSAIQYRKEEQLQFDLLNDDGGSRKHIIDHVDLQCAMGKPFHEALRLLMLQNQVDQGIKPKEYDTLRRQIINAYGFDKVITLDCLAQCNLLRKQDDTKSQYKTIKKKFNLINIKEEEINLLDENNLFCAYNGYCPIMARLVESVFQKQGWQDYKEYINLIPGDTWQGKQFSPLQKEKPCVLVYVIGGITYSELSCLRQLGRRYNKEIIIATTQIINSKKMIEQIEIGKKEYIQVSHQEYVPAAVPNPKKK